MIFVQFSLETVKLRLGSVSLNYSPLVLMFGEKVIGTDEFCFLFVKLKLILQYVLKQFWVHLNQLKVF